MKHIFLLISICLFVGCASDVIRARKVSAVFCSFKEKTYSPGDSWHPYLEPFGFMFCMRCSCTETGHVKCNTIKCPTLRCDNPVTDSQQCCPRCTDEPRIPAGLRAPVKSCRYNGTFYQPGETFANHDLFPSRQTNQCVMCTCSNGNIFCALKTCQPLTCSSPVSFPDTCCLVCKDGGINGYSSVEDVGQQLNRGVRHSVDQCAGEQFRGRSVRSTPSTVRGTPRGLSLPKLHFKGAAETTVRGTPRGLSLPKLHFKGAAETTVNFLLQKKHQKACQYSGNTYSHGDVWHPVLGKVLECILCICKDGIQDCKRLSCPSQYPCQHPVKTVGKCCKICPEHNAESNRTDCYMNLGHDNNNLLVYKVKPSSKVHTEDTVRIIAIERQGTAEVEVQVWKTVGEVLQLMETGEVLKKDLLDNPDNYTLLATLDEETWKRFKEEEDNQKEFPKTRTCEDGIREVVKFLYPDQLESLCSS
ncbi:chordin-like protein 2 isoform X1 [Oncorhynchus tshawytscha]|uniref:VWFC domain-containing protein n=1 Tax=Oncorhynchus tshawytscha TaxID=74940 RepID=A0A8C8C1G8_ONCTS|nr:chordin-like protein 2 isoform X1 [Oncorhynchus tshawytscha]